MDSELKKEQWRIWEALCKVLPIDDYGTLIQGDEVHKIVFNTKSEIELQRGDAEPPCMPDGINSKEEHDEYLRAIGYDRYIKNLELHKSVTTGLYATDKAICDFLSMFWQRYSDACPLDAKEAEKQEVEFRKWATSISWKI